MKALVFVSLVAFFVSVSAQSTNAPSPGLFAGCYEMRIQPHNSREQVSTKTLLQFQLLASPLKVPNKHFPGLMQGRILTPRDQQSLFFTWRITPNSELELHWGTMTGYQAKLAQDGDTWLGKAQHYSDFQPDGPPPPLKVAMSRISCKVEAKN
jgi:hypothetical protein